MSMPVDEFLPGFGSVDEFTQANLKKILHATKLSNDLPGEKREDFDYYSTFPEFRKVLSVQGRKLRDMLKMQLNFQGINSGVGSSQVEDLVDLLTDTNDTILERINMNLDEAAGLKREVNPLLLEVSQSNVNRVSGSWNNFNRNQKKSENKKDNDVKLLTARNVMRPQVKFKSFIDNTEKPFTPRLKEKPHSKKPLSILIEYDEVGGEFFSHPYLFEIERFSPSHDQLKPRPIPIPLGVERVDMDFIETKEQLEECIKELSKHSIIAIDLEAHSYRSYLGFTCLIQISTEHKDYLIDPFNIWGEMNLLNEITTNPSIVKVFHGCDSDVVWLQRDFSVYLVNVFDTHQAGKLLGLPRLSLAWLLEHYCKVYADKQYQLADWRIRPLPEAMVYYARQDTRYLIFLYEKLKIELLEKGNEQQNLLRAALQQSNILCSTRYYKPIRTSASHLDLLKKSKSVLNNKQLFALQELYSWRDGVARIEDESTQYILPNHMLLKICTELPREMQGILACCNPVPPLVKQHLQSLHMVILKARNKTLQTVDSDIHGSFNNTENEVAGNENEYNENPLKCPLELSNLSELGTGLKTLVSKQGEIMEFSPKMNNNLIKKKSSLGVFDVKDEEKKKKKKKEKKKKNEIEKFISPFQRYQMLRPYLESLKKSDEPDSANQQVKSADVRLESIKLHFQKLTDMTPKPKKVEIEEEEEEEEEVQNLESDEEVLPYRKSNGPLPKKMRFVDKKSVPDSAEKARLLEQVEKEAEKRKLEIENKLVQEEIMEKKKKKKRKSDEEVPFESKIPKTGAGFDYTNVDYDKMFEKSRQDRSDFNPVRHDKKNNRMDKTKQKTKNNGKSFTFKK
ncbi:exosome component 10-like [Eurytemora carolleeae]|uniref:exosome component 10-like n=1 Tax=Eurytemora carolleeae TaxID=1294199 RepID=UPI000C75A96B|nr:exosome component 10-like [Eurytemora carolleeae]|eukprot:XP_023327767.1 exosome component 10-like [Eurytemora affinis]